MTASRALRPLRDGCPQTQWCAPIPKFRVPDAGLRSGVSQIERTHLSGTSDLSSIAHLLDLVQENTSMGSSPPETPQTRRHNIMVRTNSKVPCARCRASSAGFRYANSYVSKVSDLSSITHLVDLDQESPSVRSPPPETYPEKHRPTCGATATTNLSCPAAPRSRTAAPTRARTCARISHRPFRAQAPSLRFPHPYTETYTLTADADHGARFSW